MEHQLTLTTDPIQVTALAGTRPPHEDEGAVVTFTGVVRSEEASRAITGLEYEAFPGMVEHQFGLIFKTIEQRWPVTFVRVVHRTGFVKAAEASLWVQVVASHRGEAFAACQYLIEEMKRTVPIWKKPVYPEPVRDGS
jgi:molybdopterin synthase catalytic subunit